MEFKPVFRMMVCSDIHYGESKNHPENFEYVGQEIHWFERCIDFAYKYSESCSYQGLDAIAVVGDFVTSGEETEMLEFKKSLDKLVREQTEVVITLASHEYFHDGVENGSERFERIFGQKTMHHSVNKGFHLIGVSTDNGCHTMKPKQEWLKKEMESIGTEEVGKPVFVFYHPQLSNTVYGSAVLWRTPNIMRILMNYPQVISFGGHSHAPINDPRTVYQKYFTSFGTGSVISISNCTPDMLCFSGPRDHLGKSQFLIVEVDSSNRVRVMPMDGTNGKLFGREWVIEKPSDPDSFVYTDERYRKAQTPVFDENATVDAKYEDGKLTVTVSQATDNGDRVASYQAVIKNTDGVIVRRFGFCSGYYLYDLPEKASYTVDFDAKEGKYTLECYAQSFFGRDSDKLITTFEI